MELGEGEVKFERTYLSYCCFISDFPGEFWWKIPNGDLDHGLCWAHSLKALDRI